jgi:hypothetical protein
VAQSDEIVLNSGWQPIKPDGVEDPAVFLGKCSNPQGWYYL